MKLNLINISFSDIIAGGLNANQNLSTEYIALIPHFWSELTICIKYPKPVAQWRYILSIYFDDIIWEFGLSSCLLLTVIVYLYSGLEKQPRDSIQCVLFVIGAITTVNQPYTKYCKRSRSRFQIVFCLFAAFFFANVYNAYLQNLAMIINYPNDINKIDEIYSRKMKFVASNDISVSCCPTIILSIQQRITIFN